MHKNRIIKRCGEMSEGNGQNGNRGGRLTHVLPFIGSIPVIRKRGPKGINPQRNMLGGRPKPRVKLDIPHLLEVHGDPDASSRTRHGAYQQIVNAGKDPSTREETISALRDAVKHGNDTAALALGSIVAVEAIDDLREVVRSRDSYRLPQRRKAATALGHLGEASAPAIQDLIDSFSDYSVAVSGAEALAMMGKVAVPALVKELKEGDHKVFAAYALGKMGAPAREALPELEKRTKWLWEWNGKVREAVREAIDEIKKDIILNPERRL
jgi:HEAT repeat protein